MKNQLFTQFRDYCNSKIANVATDLPPGRREELVGQLKTSPFRSVVQAWSVLDFYQYKHLHAEGYEKIIGWPDEKMSAEFILEIVHPDDQEAFGMLYYLVLEGLMNMPVPVEGIGVFCISYRIRTPRGNFVRVLETNNIIASDPQKNIPLINLSQMAKVDFGEDSNKVSYYFMLVKDESDSVKIMSEFLKQYDPLVNLFSENEIKTVRFIQAGLTSKEIADKIFLSKHSVDKYRKNLLKKTGTNSSAQLVDYMKRIGVL
jgi:DNA-binding CsgD family transcriptional regulator